MSSPPHALTTRILMCPVGLSGGRLSAAIAFRYTLCLPIGYIPGWV